MSGIVKNSSGTILIVEDDASQAHLLLRVLEADGFDVLVAGSAEAARLSLADHPQISLMVLDMGLPGMSGLELARQLKQVLPNFPFLMLTANDDPAVVRDAIAAGALSYLVKPVDVRQLLPAVRTALARYRDIEDLRQSGARLQEVVDADRAVSVAIGLLMQGQQIDLARAHEVIRGAARSSRQQIHDVARQIIKEFSQGGRSYN